MNKRSTNQRGFTLIELMITLAVIGILAAIAYPSYQSAVRKSHRNDGTSALLEAAQRLEIHRDRTAAYTNNPAEANILTTSTEGFYNNLQILNGPCGDTLNCYTLEIEPTSLRNQNKDTITAFRLHSTGVKERLEFGQWETGWK